MKWKQLAADFKGTGADEGIDVIGYWINLHCIRSVQTPREFIDTSGH